MHDHRDAEDAMTDLGASLHAWLDRLDAEDARRQKGLSEAGRPFRSAPRKAAKTKKKQKLDHYDEG